MNFFVDYHRAVRAPFQVGLKTLSKQYVISYWEMAGLKTSRYIVSYTKPLLEQARYLQACSLVPLTLPGVVSQPWSFSTAAT